MQCGASPSTLSPLPKSSSVATTALFVVQLPAFVYVITDCDILRSLHVISFLRIQSQQFNLAPASCLGLSRFVTFACSAYLRPRLRLEHKKADFIGRFLLRSFLCVSSRTRVSASRAEGASDEPNGIYLMHRLECLQMNFRFVGLGGPSRANDLALIGAIKLIYLLF